MNRLRIMLGLTALALTVGAGVAHGQQATQRPAPPRMLHPAAGKADCLSCHGPGANQHIKSTPAAHRYQNAACAMCHRPVETAPPASRHVFDDAHAACRTCHVADSPSGAKAPPAWHETFDVSICQMCHQPAAPPGPGR